MLTETPSAWKPGMDLPYVVPFGNGAVLAILLRAAWLRADRAGQPLLLPPAVRALDRLRAVFVTQEKLTPGFISSLREAAALTQEQFGRKLGVTKMTVSRWECGRMQPSESMAAAIRVLQGRLQGHGVRIDGVKRMSRESSSRHVDGKRTI